MPRYLVVANQTLAGEHLKEEIDRLCREGGNSFYVLVPNTLPSDAAIAPPSGEAPVLLPGAAVASPEAVRRATLEARNRLRQVLDEIADQGIDADGKLGDPDPLTAISEVVEKDQFDQIILSTMHIGISRWLGMDLPSRVERKFKIPVTTLTPDQ